jgi:hypothetical protein
LKACKIKSVLSVLALMALNFYAATETCKDLCLRQGLYSIEIMPQAASEFLLASRV